MAEFPFNTNALLNYFFTCWTPEPPSPSGDSQISEFLKSHQLSRLLLVGASSISMPVLGPFFQQLLDVLRATLNLLFDSLWLLSFIPYIGWIFSLIAVSINFAQGVYIWIREVIQLILIAWNLIPSKFLASWEKYIVYRRVLLPKRSRTSQ